MDVFEILGDIERLGQMPSQIEISDFKRDTKQFQFQNLLSIKQGTMSLTTSFQNLDLSSLTTGVTDLRSVVILFLCYPTASAEADIYIKYADKSVIGGYTTITCSTSNMAANCLTPFPASWHVFPSTVAAASKVQLKGSASTEIKYQAISFGFYNDTRETDE